MKQIEFNCMHCGAQVITSIEYAGEVGNCPNCGKEIEIPLYSGASSERVSPQMQPVQYQQASQPLHEPCPPPSAKPFTPPPEKSAAAAIGLNLLLFGCGYFYLGLEGGGLACLLLDGILVAACFMGGPAMFGLGIVMQIVGICDVLARCEKLKKERAALLERYRLWQAQQNSKCCPYCGETIQRTAVLCRYCGSRLD